MKKIFALAVVALLAAGCNQAATNNNTAPTPTPTPTSNLQTYQNGTYGFEFKYPSQFVFVTPSYPNLQDKVVQIQLPQGTYPNTNFGDAAFGVSASYVKSLQECLNAPTGGGTDKFATKTQINGVDFYMDKDSDAGAGNLYESTLYRTLAGNNLCVELNETIHTSNIANYPTNTVTEVDKTAVQQQLDGVLSSFAFTH